MRYQIQYIVTMLLVVLRSLVLIMLWYLADKFQQPSFANAKYSVFVQILCICKQFLTFIPEQQIVHTSVTKSCTAFNSNDAIPTERCRFKSSRSGPHSDFVRYTCSNYCAENGCNTKIRKFRVRLLIKCYGIRHIMWFDNCWSFMGLYFLIKLLLTFNPFVSWKNFEKVYEKFKPVLWLQK